MGVMITLNKVKRILQPRYKTCCSSTHSVIILIGLFVSWFFLKSGGILQSSNILLTIQVFCQHTLHFINCRVFFSYSIVAFSFQTGVIYDCPTWSTSSLLCVLCYSEGAFHYDARFTFLQEWALQWGCSILLEVSWGDLLSWYHSCRTVSPT